MSGAAAPGYDELIDWLTVKVAGYLGVRPDAIGTEIPLADYGIDSISSMALWADLNCEKGFDVETTLLWDFATIDEIAAYLTGQGSA